MGFQDSKYVQSMRERELANISEQEKMSDFRKKFKDRITSGLTEAAFRQQYNVTESDLNRFRQIKEEVAIEKKRDEAFLKGFLNPYGQ